MLSPKERLQRALSQKHRKVGSSTTVSGRQYAIAVENTTITFECQRQKHTYKINFGKRPIAKRMGADACKMMASWWSREKGGCAGECPKCAKETMKS